MTNRLEARLGFVDATALVAGSLPWCWALAYAGLRLAENWHLVREKLHGLDVAVAALVALALAWAVWHRVRALRHQQSV